MMESNQQRKAGTVLAPRVATQAMLDAVKPFPAHLAREHPDPSDPWHERMRIATIVEQAEAAALYRSLIEAYLADVAGTVTDG